MLLITYGSPSPPSPTVKGKNLSGWSRAAAIAKCCPCPNGPAGERRVMEGDPRDRVFPVAITQLLNLLNPICPLVTCRGTWRYKIQGVMPDFRNDVLTQHDQSGIGFDLARKSTRMPRCCGATLGKGRRQQVGLKHSSWVSWVGYAGVLCDLVLLPYFSNPGNISKPLNSFAKSVY